MSCVPPLSPQEEEVYNFRSDPRDNGAVVVLTVDESSYISASALASASASSVVIATLDALTDYTIR